MEIIIKIKIKNNSMIKKIKKENKEEIIVNHLYKLHLRRINQNLYQKINEWRFKRFKLIFDKKSMICKNIYL